MKNIRFVTNVTYFLFISSYNNDNKIIARVKGEIIYEKKYN